MRSASNSQLSLLSLKVFAAVLLCAAVCVPGYGQTVVGRISGTIQDANGAAIPNATVTVTNTANNLVRTGTADQNGFYTVTNLPVGTYIVEAEQKGYKKGVIAGQNVTADARLTVDLTLEAGEVTETVQIVTSGGETVNTTSGEVSRVIDTSKSRTLRSMDATTFNFFRWFPGVALLNDDQLELTTSLATGNQSINGNRGQTNNVTD